MRSRRAHTRPRHAGEEIGVTTDTDPTGAWHSLDLESQSYQALLEGHRLDPDNVELYQDLVKARHAMNTAWLEHTVITLPPAPAAKVTLGTLAYTVTLAAGSYLRVLVIRTGVHRRKQP